MPAPRKRPLPPDGDDSFGSRCAGAFAGALFAVPLCLAAWGLVRFELLQWDLDPRVMLWGVAGFALLGFALPRLLHTVYGGAWDLLGAVWRATGWH